MTSEMTPRLEATDWSKTALGPMERWPQSLRWAVGLCLGSRFPMFVWWGPELVNIYNDAYSPVLGKRHPEAFARPAREIWREIWDVVGPQADAVMSRGESTWNERVQLVMERNGYAEETWFTWSYSPIPSESGGIGGLLCVCTEETAHVLAERRGQFLVALDDASRPLADPASIARTAARMLGEYLDVNRCAYADVEADEDTFNLTGDYVRGVPSVVGRYRFSQFGEDCLRHMREGRPYVIEDIDTHEPSVGDRTGYEHMSIVSVICVPIKKAGRFVGAIAVHKTVPRRWTGIEIDLVRHVASRCWESIQRSRVEWAFRESESRFRNMSDNAPVMIWVTGPDGACEYLNAQWYAFTGQTPSGALGLGWLDAIHPEDIERTRATLLAASATSSPFKVEYRLRKHDGEYGWCIDAAAPRTTDGGAFRGYVGSVVDITERKRVEDALRISLEAEQEARTVAERASRTKDEFLATLSHELRTPLNAVLGWASILLRKEQIPKELLKGLTVIDRNARSQAKIIEDLLDMSAIISGKVRLDLQRTELVAVVAAAVDTARPTAEAKGVTLRAPDDSSLRGIEVNGDASRLQQVFWNVLSNAIKFTERGGTVDLALRRSDTHVEVHVHDTGEGIAEAFLPFVFDRFRQADASTSRKYGGLGLGLSIARQLVELHGGRIAASSEGPGKGATFIVELPVIAAPTSSSNAAEVTEATGTSPPSRSAIGGVHALVVDDDDDAREIVRRVLEDEDVLVETATSSEEAYALLQTRRFDVLLSDIGMPGEDGFRLIQRVRSLGAGSGGDIPAIALTAYASVDDRYRVERAGFQTHLTKPVDTELLVATVARVVRPR